MNKENPNLKFLKFKGTLKNAIPNDAELLCEVHNNLNILGISKQNNIYHTTWISKIDSKLKDYTFDNLNKAMDIYNLIMELQF